MKPLEPEPVEPEPAPEPKKAKRNVIKRLKRAIGMASEVEKERGLTHYERHLTENAKKKLKNRKRDVVAKKSRRRNQKRSRGKRWRGR
jgi:hypothetical protein